MTYFIHLENFSILITNKVKNTSLLNSKFVPTEGEKTQAGSSHKLPISTFFLLAVIDIYIDDYPNPCKSEHKKQTRESVSIKASQQ